MVCKECQQNIEAYLDGELTLSDRRDFEDHLNECPDCQAMLESVRSLNSTIRKIAYASRPAGLRRRIKSGLRDLSGEESPGFGWPQLLGFGGSSAALAGVAVWAVMSFMLYPPLQAQLAGELISAHVRSMQVDHMTDITSTDRHTVKPWFNGRLDFSPSVIDFKEQAYPLIGGRLDYLNKQTVAAVVYKRRAHIINLFIAKSDSPAQARPARLVRQQGYHLIRWQAQGLDYYLVSDLNTNELQSFAAMVQATTH